MDAKTDSGGFRDIFKEFHLIGFSVVANAIDVVSHAVLVEHAVLFDFRVEAVHQNVFTALSGVDEFEAFIGIPAVSVVSSQMVGDRAGVPVVPVGDPSEGFVGG